MSAQYGLTCTLGDRPRVALSSGTPPVVGTHLGSQPVLCNQHQWLANLQWVVNPPWVVVRPWLVVNPWWGITLLGS